MNEESRQVTDRNYFVVVLGFGVIAIQLVVGYAIYSAFESWDARGTFGDMFGAVNALFSGLAFAGVIYAILLQRHELSLQRLELELTRRELERAADAHEHSSRLLEMQLELMRRSHKLGEDRVLAELKPIFSHNGGQRSPGHLVVKFINEGGAIRDLQASPEGSFEVTLTPDVILKNGSSGQFEINHRKEVKPPFIVALEYTDLIGVRGRVRLACGEGKIYEVKE